LDYFLGWKNLRLILGFGIFLDHFLGLESWGCFRSMTSFNSDVLMDTSDYDIPSSNNNEELFWKTQRVHELVFTIAVANANTLDLFNSKELYLNVGQLVDHKVSVRDMFNTMRVAPSLFKTLTNFNFLKFEDLFVLVVPFIQAHAKTTNEAHIMLKWSTKLTPNQCLLKFILYMKHDNVVM
jgi:hypothetical protein